MAKRYRRRRTIPRLNVKSIRTSMSGYGQSPLGHHQIVNIRIEVETKSLGAKKFFVVADRTLRHMGTETKAMVTVQ
jgi:hypothetical protein